MSSTIWGRRFAGREQVPVLERFNSSIAADSFLLGPELRASAAYARALGGAGVLKAGEMESMLKGLAAVEDRGREPGVLDNYEDVHTAVELMLVDEIGETGKKLHTGRSRNEQVATDERLFLKDEVPALIARAEAVQKALLALAEGNRSVVMPGYTHLQRGQPISFAQYALSFFWAMERGKARLSDALKRVDVMPLGSGALAGSTVPIDREKLASSLGFSGPSENSLDAVGDRSFILETLFALEMVLLDISRLAEDLVLFSTAEFGFLDLDASVATSSSLMPQKKNPDIFELLRAAPARLAGHLMRMLMLMKGIPSSYSKDLQDDKEPLRQGVEDAGEALDAAAAALVRIRPRPERMRAAITPDLFATDLVDLLVGRGVAFRDAHGAVAAAVGTAEGRGVDIASLTREERAAIHPLFEDVPDDLFDAVASIARKRTYGSTNPDMIELQILKARAILGLMSD